VIYRSIYIYIVDDREVAHRVERVRVVVVQLAPPRREVLHEQRLRLAVPRHVVVQLPEPVRRRQRGRVLGAER
jgi:hypothetical protein